MHSHELDYIRYIIDKMMCVCSHTFRHTCVSVFDRALFHNSILVYQYVRLACVSYKIVHTLKK